MEEKTDSCYNCIYKRNVPGDAHIACSNPDPNMTGNPHGIKKGWFFYPVVFDPIWMTKKCDNFKNLSVSDKN
jgi:hypothetical protein